MSYYELQNFFKLLAESITQFDIMQSCYLRQLILDVIFSFDLADSMTSIYFCIQDGNGKRCNCHKSFTFGMKNFHTRIVTLFLLVK